MIIRNGKELENLYSESQQIDKVMFGDKLVWENNRIIDLGTNTDFDVSQVYSKYADLTEDNFFLVSQTPTTLSGSASAYVDETGHQTYLTIWTGLVKEYDPSTGALSFYQYDEFVSSSTIAPSTSVKKKASVHAVIITKPEKLISLGLGTAFNIKGMFPNEYQNFTADNFVAKNWKYVNGGQQGYLLHGVSYIAGSYSGSTTTTFFKTYDSTNGILRFGYTNSVNGGDSITNEAKVYAYLTRKKV